MNEKKLNEFLERLTALSQQYGFGIDGGGLYELQPEDAERKYVCDEDSLIDFI